jgi:hypothetical protein
MTFRIVTPADTTQLTTLATLKEELADKITGLSDAALKRLLNRATGEIATYLNVPVAADGSARLGLETIEETLHRSPWLHGHGHREIVLSRKPVTEIISVVVGGSTIDDTGYELDPAAGILKRVWSPTTFAFNITPGARSVITYKAGWTLPGDDPEDYTMPPQLEGAVLSLINLAISQSTRDPTVKTQWVTDIERLDFWVGAIGENGSIPPEIADKLAGLGYEPAFG